VNDDAQDRLTPAEERLVRLLALLRVQAEEAQTSLQQAVMQRVRWQLLARQLGHAVAQIAGALTDGLALVFGAGSRGKERRR
jgi:hypothetical protein